MAWPSTPGVRPPPGRGNFSTPSLPQVSLRRSLRGLGRPSPSPLSGRSGGAGRDPCDHGPPSHPRMVVHSSGFPSKNCPYLDKHMRFCIISFFFSFHFPFRLRKPYVLLQEIQQKSPQRQLLRSGGSSCWPPFHGKTVFSNSLDCTVRLAWGWGRSAWTPA